MMQHKSPTLSRTPADPAKTPNRATEPVIDLRTGPTTPTRPGPAPRQPSRFGSPHRTASQGIALSTLATLVASALAWSAFLDGRWTVLGCTAALCTFTVLGASGYFRVNMNEGGRVKLRTAAGAASFGVIAALFAISLPGLTHTPPGARNFVALMLTMTAAATVSRLVGRWGLEALWKRGHLRATAIVLGYDAVAKEMALEVSHRPAYGVDVAAFVTVDEIPVKHPSLPQPIFRPESCTPDEVEATVAAAIDHTDANRLLIGPCGSIDDRVAQIAARWAATRGMAVHAVPRFHQMGMGMDSMTPDRARGYALVRMQRSAHPFIALRVKRLIDVAVSVVVLVALSPVLAAAALLVKLSGPGGVLYSQERVGQHGRIIKVYKFRSMVAGNGDTDWDPKDRITRIGAFLRRTNVDELPQLFTILRGDMSLVGPRPERPAFVEEFRQDIPDYDDRHRFPVGLTGLAQVVGLRGDTSISERVKYDNLYIDQWSLRSDFEILAQTVTAVLFQSKKSAEMERLEEAVK